MMSGTSSTEVTLGEQQTHEHTIKINNFKRFVISQKEFRSNHIEIFPGKKIAFVINILDPWKRRFTKYTPIGVFGGKRTRITEDDNFISLNLVSGEGFELPRLAGKVEIVLGDTIQSFDFGDHQKEKYLEFDADERSLDLEPGKLTLYTDYNMDRSRVLLKITDAGKEDSLKIKFTLFSVGEITQIQERSLLDSLPGRPAEDIL